MTERLDVDSYFMEISRVVASRSTCLHRQIGAVLVKGKQIVSTGYNGAPAGHPHCLEVGCARQSVPSGERSELCHAAHAEQNAINFAARFGIPIEGATLYTTTYPAPGAPNPSSTRASPASCTSTITPIHWPRRSSRSSA